MKKYFKIGLRNIKTALALLICLLLFTFFDRSPLLACLAAALSMQDTIENSTANGKARIIGTLIGGFYGSIFHILAELVNFDITSTIMIAIGVILIIHSLNLINQQNCIAFSLSVYLIIAISVPDHYIMYGVDRTIDTLIGVIISLIINKSIKPRVKEVIEKEEIN